MPSGVMCYVDLTGFLHRLAYMPGPQGMDPRFLQAPHPDWVTLGSDYTTREQRPRDHGGELLELLSKTLQAEARRVVQAQLGQCQQTDCSPRHLRAFYASARPAEPSRPTGGLRFLCLPPTGFVRS